MLAAPAPSERPQPSNRPGVRASLRRGWGTLRNHFWVLLVVTLIYLGVEALSNVFTVDAGPGGPGQPLAGLSLLYSVLVTGPLVVGVAHVFLEAARGEEPGVEDVLAGFRTYVNAVGGMLLYGLAVAVGLVLLVVPGLVALVRLSFTPFLVVERDLSPTDAVKASWEATRGHGWSLFGLFLLSLLILVGGLIVLVVGVVVALAWVWASWATYYDRATTTVDPAPADGRLDDVPPRPRG